MTKTIVEYQKLRKKIIAAHQNYNSQIRSALVSGYEAGQLLTEAKTGMDHGDFLPWIRDNLPFKERTAQNYMHLWRNRAILEGASIETLSGAYKTLTPPPKNDEEVEPASTDSTTQREENTPEIPSAESEVVAEVEIGSSDDRFPYWTDLSRLLQTMQHTYERMAAKRNHTTPKALGYMIGNIAEMAKRLKSWDPELMRECTSCGGTGQMVAAEDGSSVVMCDMCIGGKVGEARATEL
jgi:hypothetical protein